MSISSKTYAILTVIGLVLFTYLLLFLSARLIALKSPLVVLIPFVWAAYLGYFTYSSVTILPPDEMLVTTCVGEPWEVYITEGFAQEKNERGKTMLEEGGKRSWFGNIVILPWPAFDGTLFPTTEFTVYYLVRNAFTKKGGPLAPPAPIDALVSFQIRLAPGGMKQFVRVFDVLGPPNLAAPSLVYINAWHEKKMRGEETGDKYQYDGNLLECRVSKGTRAKVPEVLRRAIGQVTFGGSEDTDVFSYPQGTEELIRRELGADKNSVFRQAGLINEDGTIGPAAIQFDIQLPDMTVNFDGNPLAVAAQAAFDAKAETIRGIGRGQSLKEAAEAAGSGMTPTDILAAETLRDSNATVITTGTKILDAFRQVTGIRNKPKKGKKKQ